MARAPIEDATARAAMLPDATWLRALRRRLLVWYGAHRRDLPWRESSDPYRVWVSEIMLQQTQVATVIPYFRRFVAAFPDVAALAAADEHDVLRAWEGLGYYRRARQLHRAASQIVAEHAGNFPEDLDQVRALAGIGRYTAGAILSIAFDKPAPILEANTVRLYSRLLAFAGDTSGRDGQQLLWRFAEAVLPRRRSGTLNQALMELGSQICTPRTPRCDDCPVCELCGARRLGAQDTIPAARRKPKFEAVREAAVVVRRGRRVLLRKHVAGERWAGLWDFPRFGLAASRPEEVQRALAAGVLALCGIRSAPGEHLATLKHGVTRFRITLECYLARCLPGPSPTAAGVELEWARPAALPGYALSTTGRKIARLLMAERE
jgi:A/G-specific adenine glycosylase